MKSEQQKIVLCEGKTSVAAAPKRESDEMSTGSVQSRTSLWKRVVEKSLHGHAAAPVTPTDPASVLANVRAEDAIAAYVLQRERRKRSEPRGSPGVTGEEARSVN